MNLFAKSIGACLFAITTLLVGCSAPPEPFRVGTNIWLGYESLYLAKSLGRYDKTAIRLVTMKNATEVQNALRSGMLEAAALTLDEALSVKQDGFDIKVVLVMDYSNGADVLLARPAIKDMASLRGKRVGVESSAVGAVLLHAALQASGLTVADIHPVHLTIDKHISAFESGVVDAVVTFEPVRTQLLQSGARLLFDSSRIPERIVDVLVVAPGLSTHHEQQLGTLVRGHFAALDYFRSDSSAAAEKMVVREGVSAEAIITAFQGLRIPGLADNRRLLNSAHPALADNARHLAELMLTQKLLERPVDIDGLFVDHWLPSK